MSAPEATPTPGADAALLTMLDEVARGSASPVTAGVAAVRAAARLRALAGEVARARAALRKYGQHEEGCSWLSATRSDAPCPCGLVAALAGEGRADG